ncbi:hypothetical protein TNCV_2160851 [Trichonephila clavipes]|nr:hypothetical protein TNCV_2160851 [Trichonephila clavipes]
MSVIRRPWRSVAQIFTSSNHSDGSFDKKKAMGSKSIARPEGMGSMLDVTKYPPSAHGFTCRNCGGGDRGQSIVPSGSFNKSHCHLHLRFDIFELQETKLPVRLIITTNERRLVQGYETPKRVKGDIEDVSSELDNGD